MNTFVLMFLWLQANSTSDSTGPWIEPAPFPRKEWVELSPDSFFEVAASKRDAAMYSLHEPSVSLDGEGRAAYYGNRSFLCKHPSNAYLVRAPYTNGGTGNFALYIARKSLIVEHGSLGGGSSLEQSALVVCLADRPEKVYSSIANSI